MSGGVQQRDPDVPQGKGGLLGEYGDPPLPLQGVGVQKGVPVVYAAQGADGAGGIEQRFR